MGLFLEYLWWRRGRGKEKERIGGVGEGGEGERKNRGRKEIRIGGWEREGKEKERIGVERR